MTLGQRILQLRKERGLSQEALGEQLGVSRQAISKWESDITIPEIDKLIALSKLFGVSVGSLLGVEENDPTTPAAEELTDRELEGVGFSSKPNGTLYSIRIAPAASAVTHSYYVVSD